jgi:hypothetical protein
MDELTNVAVSLAQAISLQFAILNWPLIISGAGIGEVLNTRQYRNKKRPMHWSIPLIMGFVFGVPQYLQVAAFKNLFTYINGAVVSGIVYAGMIVVVYVIGIKPFKAITTRIAGEEKKDKDASS